MLLVFFPSMGGRSLRRKKNRNLKELNYKFKIYIVILPTYLVLRRRKCDRKKEEENEGSLSWFKKHGNSLFLFYARKSRGLRSTVCVIHPPVGGLFNGPSHLGFHYSRTAGQQCRGISIIQNLKKPSHNNKKLI
jgi:hypothetical protein